MENNNPLMKKKNQEIEAKFPVNDLSGFIAKLKYLGAELVLDDSYEHNILLDTPEKELLKSSARLRLRDENGKFILTYKQTRKKENNISYRDEIETSVDDIENARLIFERLGYEVTFEYEKYRSTYRLQDGLIMLDRTPLGSFIEIEAAGEDEIRLIVQKIDLDWDLRTDKSYVQLFEEWASKTGNSGRKMLFSEID